MLRRLGIQGIPALLALTICAVTASGGQVAIETPMLFWHLSSDDPAFRSAPYKAYPDSVDTAEELRAFPPGIRVDVFHLEADGTELFLRSILTDSKGRVVAPPSNPLTHPEVTSFRLIYKMKLQSNLASISFPWSISTARYATDVVPVGSPVIVPRDAADFANGSVNILRELHVFSSWLRGKSSGPGAFTGIPRITVEQFNDRSAGFQHSLPFIQNEIGLGVPEFFTREVIYHEYAHAIMAELFPVYHIRGVHRPWPSESHTKETISHPRFALIEGWAEFMADVAAKNPGFHWPGGTAEENGSWNIIFGSPHTGEEVEGALETIWWDLTDPDSGIADSDGDGVGPGFGTIWRCFSQRRPNTFKDFWDCYMADLSSDQRQAFRRVSERNGVVYSRGKLTKVDPTGGIRLIRIPDRPALGKSAAIAAAPLSASELLLKTSVEELSGMRLLVSNDALPDSNPRAIINSILHDETRWRVAAEDSDPNGGFFFTFDTEALGLVDGKAYAFLAQAKDENGTLDTFLPNRAPSSTVAELEERGTLVRFIVDRTAPTVTLRATNGGVISAQSIVRDGRFSVEIEDTVSRIQQVRLELLGATGQPLLTVFERTYAAPVERMTQSLGPLRTGTYRLVATDAAGNENVTSGAHIQVRNRSIHFQVTEQSGNSILDTAANPAQETAISRGGQNLHFQVDSVGPPLQRVRLSKSGTEILARNADSQSPQRIVFDASLNGGEYLLEAWDTDGIKEQAPIVVGTFIVRTDPQSSSSFDLATQRFKTHLSLAIDSLLPIETVVLLDTNLQELQRLSASSQKVFTATFPNALDQGDYVLLAVTPEGKTFAKTLSLVQSDLQEKFSACGSGSSYSATECITSYFGEPPTLVDSKHVTLSKAEGVFLPQGTYSSQVVDLTDPQLGDFIGAVLGVRAASINGTIAQTAGCSAPWPNIIVSDPDYHRSLDPKRVPVSVGASPHPPGPSFRLSFMSGTAADSLDSPIEVVNATTRFEFWSNSDPAFGFSDSPTCPAEPLLPLKRFVRYDFAGTSSPKDVRIDCENDEHGNLVRCWGVPAHAYAFALWSARAPSSPVVRFPIVGSYLRIEDSEVGLTPRVLAGAAPPRVEIPSCGSATFSDVTKGGSVRGQYIPKDAPVGFVSLIPSSALEMYSDAVFREAIITCKVDFGALASDQRQKARCYHGDEFSDVTAGVGPDSISCRTKSFSPFFFVVPEAAYFQEAVSNRTVGGASGAPAEAVLAAMQGQGTLEELPVDSPAAIEFIATAQAEGLTSVSGIYRLGTFGAVFAPAAKLEMRYSDSGFPAADLDTESVTVVLSGGDSPGMSVPSDQSVDLGARVASLSVKQGGQLAGVFARKKDRASPTTAASLSGSVDGLPTMGSPMSRLTLIATDAATGNGRISGVASIYFKIDPSPAVIAGGLSEDTLAAFDVYSIPFAVPPGVHTVIFGALDRAGNAEQLRSATISIDDFAPSLALKLNGADVDPEALSFSILPSDTLGFSAEDTDGVVRSGLSHVLVSADDAESVPYAGSFRLAEGQHRVEAKAVDKAGNISGGREFVFDVRRPVESEPPATGLTLLGEQVEIDGRTYVSEKTRVQLDSHDPEDFPGAASGVASTVYALDQVIPGDDGPPAVAYISPFTLPEGEHRVRFRSRDKAGNVEEPSEASLMVDGTAPNVILSLIGPSLALPGGETLLGAESKVSLTADDPSSLGVASGVKAILMLFDQTAESCGFSGDVLPPVTPGAPEGSCPNPYYSAPASLAEGPHLLAHAAVDRVGNIGEIQAAPFRVDATPPSPITTLVASAGSVGTATLSWTAPEDNLAGVAEYEIRYSAQPMDEARFDQGTVVGSPPAPEAPGTRQSLTINGLTPGVVHYFAIRSRDKVGNRSGLSNAAEARPPVVPDIETIAGTASAGDTGDGGLARAARLNSPGGVAVDRRGNVFISDSQNHRVRRVDALSGLIKTVAGDGVAGFNGDGPATSRHLFAPGALAVDSAGNLFILDRANQRVRRVDAQTGEMTTFGGPLGFTATALALGDNGRVYLSHPERRVVSLGADGGLATVAGNGLVANGAAQDGSLAGSQAIGNPTAISVDRFGNVFFGTLESFGDNRHRIYRVEARTGRIFLVAGGGTQSGEGISAFLAELAVPSALAVEDDGTIFFVESERHRVRKILSSGIYTAAGTGTAGFGGDGGFANLALMNQPAGIAVDGAGYVYVADTANHRIRRFGSGFSDAEEPTPITDLAIGETKAFSVSLSWSAPFDINSRVASYELRYSDTFAPDHPGKFDLATLVKPGPAVLPPGTRQEITVTGLRAGTSYAFALRSRDASGNRASVGLGASATTRLDDASPNTVISFDGPSYETVEGTYVPGAGKAVLTSIDPAVTGQTTSGIDHIYFALEPTPQLLEEGLNEATLSRFQVYSSPLSGPEGRVVLAFGARDTAGNSELLKLATIFIDATPPVSSLDIQGSSKVVGGVIEVSEGSLIGTVTEDPSLTGIVPLPGAGSAYGVVLVDVPLESCGFMPGVPPQMNPSAEAGTCANPTLPNRIALPVGEHQITLQAADRVGNLETVKVISLKVVPTPPPVDFRESKRVEFAFAFGTRGSAPSQFEGGSILDAAVDKEGNVYLPDLVGGDIIKFDRHGNFLQDWQAAFSPVGEGIGPAGVNISFDSDMEHIVVADAYQKSIKIFSKEGALIKSFGPALGNGGPNLSFPSGVACDGAGHLFIADLFLNSIIKTDHEGNFIRSWYSGTNTFLVKTDADGAVYVAQGAVIHKYDPDGNLLQDIGIGKLSSAKGLALDAYGTMFVPDNGGNGCGKGLCIQAFSSAGTWLGGFGKSGSAPGQFSDLWGMGIDKTRSRLYIPTHGDPAVQVYDILVPTVDVKAPITSLASSVQYAKDTNGIAYISTFTLLDLAAIDQAPAGMDPIGVAYSEYRLNSFSETSPWTRFTQPIALGPASQTRFDFRSVDKNGNVEAYHTERFQPVNNWLTSAVVVDGAIVTEQFGDTASLKPGVVTTASALRIAMQSPVGVAAFDVTLDGAGLSIPAQESDYCDNWSYPGLGPGCAEARVAPELTSLSAGPHILTWSARDRIGNATPLRTVTFDAVPAPANPILGSGFKRAGTIDTWPLGGMIPFQDVAVDASGTAFALGTDSRIYQFDPTGAFVRQLPSYQWGSTIADGYPAKIGYYSPYDPRLFVVVGGRGYWFQSGRENSGLATIGDGSLSGVSDGAFDAGGNFLLTVPSLGKIYRFGQTGVSLLGTFGERGSGPGQFATGPHHIAVAADGTIYATDNSPGRLLKFDKGGAFLASIPCSFGEPAGITVDGFGNVFVSDRATKSVHVLGPSGAMVFEFGSGTEGGPVLGDPGGLDIHRNSLRLLVADREKPGLAVYRPDAPPTAVADLTPSAGPNGQVILSWTAPSDDGEQGTAASYDLRYSPSPIETQAQFEAAEAVPGMPTPASAGTAQSVAAAGLPNGTMVHFRLQSRDAAGGKSALSNPAVFTTPFVAASATTIDGREEALFSAAQQVTVTDVAPTSAMGDVVIGKATDQGLVYVGTIFDLGPEGATFNPPASLTMTYSETSLAALGLTEADIAIYHFDATRGWELVPDQARDPDANSITIHLDHVASIFALLAPARDRTPPATTVYRSSGSVLVDASGAWTASTATLLGLRAMDPAGPAPEPVSGVAFTEYRVDVGTGSPGFIRWSAPFAIPQDALALEFRSVDSAGNIESVRRVPLIVDAAPPNSTLQAGPPSFTTASGTFVSSASFLMVLSSDAVSGLKSVAVAIDGQPVLPATAPFRLSGGEGPRLISFQAVDRVANVEALSQTTVFLDLSAPETLLSVDGPNALLSDGITLAVSSLTALALTASDPAREGVASGVRETLVGIDTAPLAAQDGSFRLLEPRPYLLRFKSADNVANEEELRTAAVVVDAAPPGISVSSPASGDRYVARGEPILMNFSLLDAYDPAPSNSAFLVRLEDRGSPAGDRPGVVAVSNGQAIAALDLDDGLWELRVSATDFVLNSVASSGGAFEVLHDVLPPRTSLAVGEPRADGGPEGAAFVTAGTDLALQSVDDLVALNDGIGLGVARQELSVDGVSRGSFANPDSANATFRSTFTLQGDSDGLHVLRFGATDSLSNAEAVQVATVAVDNTAPLTSLALSGGRQAGADVPDAFYASTGTVFALSAADPEVNGVAAGLETTFLRFNEDAPTALSSTFTLSEGRKALSYWSRDRLGNLEVARSTTALVDGTPPVSAAAVGAPSFVDEAGVRYVSSSTLVALNAADPALPDGTAGSGLDQIQLSLDAGDFSTYASSLTFAEGRRLLRWRALDRVGNLEAAQSLELRSDASAPETSLAILGGRQAPGSDPGSFYASSDTRLALPAADPVVAEVASGLDSTRWHDNGGAFAAYTAPITLGEGVHALGYQSQDHVGTLEVLRSTTVLIDATAPQSAYQVGSPSFLDADGTRYVTPTTPVSFTAQDPALPGGAAGSGVERIEVSVDGAPYALYSAALTLTEGRHVLSFRAVDRVGNIEAEQTLALRSDASAPQTALVVQRGRQAAGADAASFYASPDTRFALPAADPVVAEVASGLDSTSWQDNGGAFQAYSAPLALSEGSHLLAYRSRDQVQNLEVLHSTTALIDATPPVTAFQLGAPSYTDAAGVRYVTPATPVTFSAADPALPGGTAGSGVERIEVAVDGAPFAPYSAALNFAEGRHTVRYRALDRVGNLEAERTLALRSDASAPQSAFAAQGGAQVQGPDAGSMYASADTRFVLSAADPVAADVASGVDFIRWQENGGAFQAYGGPISLGEGSHLLTYQAQDNVQNLEAARSTTVLVDATAPRSSFALGAPAFVDAEGARYVAPATPVSFSAEDPDLAGGAPGSGVERIEVSVDGAGYVAYSGPLTFPEGRHVILFRGHDRVGNVEAEQTLALRSDSSAPLSSLAVQGGRQAPGPDAASFYASSDTRLALLAADPVVADVASGVESTRWQDNGGPLQAYSAPIALAEGAHLFSYHSRDHVDNAEAARSTTVLVDATPPITQAALTGPRYAQTSGDDSVGGSLFVSPATRIDLVAQDPVAGGVASGLDRTLASVDGGATLPWTGAVSFAQEGAHSVSFRSYDRVGGEETLRALALAVDATPPATGLSFDGPALVRGPGTSWTPEEAEVFVTPATRLILTARDQVSNRLASGVKLTRYRVDTGPWLVYAGTFTLTNQGLHLVEFAAEDRVGNVESTIAKRIAVDATGPATTAAVTGPYLEAFGLNLLSTAAAVSLSAADPAAAGVAVGAAKTYYRLDGGGLVEYSAPFALSPGSHTIQHHAVDLMGNAGTPQTLSVRVLRFLGGSLAATGAIDGSGKAQISGLLQTDSTLNLTGDVAATGGAEAFSISLKGHATLTGPATQGVRPLASDAIDLAAIQAALSAANDNAKLPAGSVSNGELRLSGHETVTLGTGSYLLSGLKLSGHARIIAAGPVRLFVTDQVHLTGNSALNEAGPAKNLAIFGTAASAKLSAAALSAVIYLPSASLELSGDLRLGGSVLAASVSLSGDSNATAPGLEAAAPAAVTGSGGDKGGKLAAASAEGGFAPAAGTLDTAFVLRDVYAFPNPAVRGQRPVLHAAVGIADKVTFRLYDISGQPVHEATINSTPQVIDDGTGPKYAYEYVWDGHIPSGVYLYVIVAEKSGHAPIKRVGKLAVVR